jgi:hypothetical protein
MAMTHPESVKGGQTGLMFPTTIEPLLAMGAEFLTDAFRRTGAISASNRVTSIVKSTEFYGGGMGRKLLLSVTYDLTEAGVHRDLFVKFPRNFGDPLRELFGPLMEQEVRFALLSRLEGFPVAVPKCYFADYDAHTKSGILITECIEYGHGAIEPRHDKCLDYRLPDPLGHYEALTRAMARLAGFHKSGRFGAGIDEKFPFDPRKIDIGARIPYTPEQLQGKLEKLKSFAAEHPQLFPDFVGSKDFLDRFEREAPLVLEHELAIRRYLNEKVDYVALCHWNMNLDNAWFWRDTAGELHAGLLDWGSVGQMNVAQAFYGMYCAAETSFLNEHKRNLILLFVDEYHRNGGPAIDAAELAYLIKLSVAVLGIAWILDAPSLVEGEIPDVHLVEGRFDPKLENNFLARAQLHLLIVLLNEWRVDHIGAALGDFAAVADPRR